MHHSNRKCLNTVQIAVLWAVTTCSLVGGYHCIRGKCIFIFRVKVNLVRCGISYVCRLQVGTQAHRTGRQGKSLVCTNRNGKQEKWEKRKERKSEEVSYMPRHSYPSKTTLLYMGHWKAVLFLHISSHISYDNTVILKKDLFWLTILCPSWDSNN
jgi:hypothetical protein